MMNFGYDSLYGDKRKDCLILIMWQKEGLFDPDYV